MFYRNFGSTGVEVSALGMGCMRFEEPHKIDEMAEVVCRASERGVTYFDTAPGYCDDKSEFIVGAAVQEMKKAGRPFVLATKCGSDNPAVVRQQCERSLERLHVDAIDFYHVWCLVRPDDLPGRIEKGAVAEFGKLKDEGLVRHVCVSTHLEHDNIAAMLDQGEGLFEGMLLGLSAANFDLRYPGVREAARRGMGVVTMNTLGGGLIPKHPEHFEFIRHEGDSSLTEAAVRFNLSLPEVTVALVGFRNKADVDEVVDGVDRFTPLSPEAIAGHHDRMAAAGRDFCTQCGYCRDCPADIPIVRIMDAYNQRLLDGPQAAIDMMKYHWGIRDVSLAIEACTECRQCEEACTQHLPILERFDELRQFQRALDAKNK